MEEETESCVRCSFPNATAPADTTPPIVAPENPSASPAPRLASPTDEIQTQIPVRSVAEKKFRERGGGAAIAQPRTHGLKSLTPSRKYPGLVSTGARDPPKRTRSGSGRVVGPIGGPP
eukprot:1949741-Rhodomonas_salina.2